MARNRSSLTRKRTARRARRLDRCHNGPHQSSQFLQSAVTKNMEVTPSAAAFPAPVAERMSGADIILRVLSEQGVDTVFGYGGGAILPTYDAVFRFNAIA